jgi:hypothetical protein
MTTPNPIHVTPGQFKRLERNLNAADRPEVTMPRLMEEFQRAIEKKIGRRLTPEEQRSKQFRGDARAYAVAVMRWIKKDRKP